jgi:hypothetical protein
MVARMRSRGWAVLGACTIAALPSAACGDIEDQSLCAVYEDFLADRAAVAAIDLEETSAGEAADVAEDYLDTVRHLQEVADTRYGAQLYDLELAVADVLRTLESVPEDTDDSTWLPLVEDSVEDAANLAVGVVETLGVQCPQAGDQ